MDTLLPSTDDPLLARALDAGAAAWRRGELAAAHALLEQSLARARARGDTAGLLGAHQILAHVAYDAGDLDTAQAHHQTVLRLCCSRGLRLGEASALHNLGLVAAARGEQATAHRLLTEAADQYDAVGHATGAAAARANLERLVAHWAQQGGEVNGHG